MTKKIIAIFLCIILIVGLFPIGIISNAVSDDFTVSIIADKPKYEKGDIITYTLKIKQTGTLTAFGFNLNVPDGLTYVNNIPNNEANNILGFNGQMEGFSISVQKPKDIWYYHISGMGANPYKGNEEITLGTISFRVNENAGYGKLTVDVLHDDDLTATNEEYAEKTLNINNSVVTIEKTKVPSNGITVTPTNAKVAVGKNIQLDAKLSPTDSTDKITWKSDNENIAKVDSNGLVTGISIGEAKIIATTESGKKAEVTLVVECNHEKTTKHEAVKSTCQTHGHGEYYTCDICGKVTSGSKEELPLADHIYGEWNPEILPKHENKESLPGRKGFYQCSECKKLFDINHKEIKDLTIPAEPHSPQGGYKFDTKNHWKECGCGILINVEPHKLGEPKIENVIPATCEQDGSHVEIVNCSICGYEVSRKTVVDKATGHVKGEKKLEKIEKPTCEKDGSYEEVYYCTKCGKELERKKVVEKALGHKPGNKVKENIVEATHSSEGSYDEVVYCSVCNKEISRNKKIIPMIPHSPKDNKWESDENNHWQICGCGVKINIDKHIKANSVKENIVPATCEKEGSHDEVEYCSVCNRELSRTKVIDKAKGHIEGKVIKEKIKAPTCLKEGSHEEVVYCSVCNKELSRTKVIDEALGHTGGTANCSKKAICTRCGLEYGEVNPNNHTGNIEIKNYKESTLKEEGYTGDKYCKDCGKLIEKGKKTDKFVYELLDGKNNKCEEKTSNSLTFRANGKLENLENVYIDDVKMVKDVDYTAKSGSTIITLSAKCLNKLSVGKHTLKINYNDGGFVSTDFEITKAMEVNKEEATNNSTITPKTIDNSNINLWIMGVIISGICLIGVTKWKTEKKVKSKAKRLK